MFNIDIHKTLSGSSETFQLSINCKVKKGDFVAIYGLSGAGKTSFLRMLAGLDQPDSGTLSFGNNYWHQDSGKINLSPQQRKVGFVFQDYALFPNMTVRKNLEYALSKGQQTTIIDELLDVLELNELQNRKPDTLSGGQKQRVALARSLVQQPKVLLLDEPLSALDHQMRQKLQDYLLKIHQHFNLTTFIVSHDLSEIFKLSNHVLHLEQGKVIAEGNPDQIFLEKKISGKYNMTGTIVSIKNADTVCIANVLSGQNLVQVIITPEKAKTLQIGDTVLVVSKAFNPILLKID